MLGSCTRWGGFTKVIYCLFLISLVVTVMGRGLLLLEMNFTNVLHLTELENSFVKQKRGSSGLMQTDQMFSE